MLTRIQKLDARIAAWMEHYGHFLHRICLGAFFIWLGGLKIFGFPTATSMIAKVIYWGDTATMVLVLGWAETAIGLCLIVRPFIRAALFLLALRLPGSVLALFLMPDICFVSIPFVPTIEGLFMIKDIILFSAAMVIGGTVRIESDSAKI